MTKYYCDRCGVEADSHDKLKKVLNENGIPNCMAELCEFCWKSLHDFLRPLPQKARQKASLQNPNE